MVETLQTRPGAELQPGTTPVGDSFDLNNVMLVDGTGAPAYGPATVRVRGGVIDAIEVTASAVADIIKPGFHTEAGAVQVPQLDGDGSYVLPGFVDAHAHIGRADQSEHADYVYKLWLANGVTTVREAGSFWNGLPFVVSEAKRSANKQIAAPYLLPYAGFGQGAERGVRSVADVEPWLKAIAEKGAAGVKFLGARPDIFQKALELAPKYNLGTMCHHAQTDVGRVTALDTARWGLQSIEHAYGIPESMFQVHRLQQYPPDHNHEDEARRFAQLGRLWQQAAKPGSKKWQDTISELVDLGVSLTPTMVAYIASRDYTRAVGRLYHRQYTTARMARFFAPRTDVHGSYFADWTSVNEADWKNAFKIWMRFIRDFNDTGGRVCVGSDAGFIFNLYGFGFIEEMELLVEAGLTPLEVIRAATLSGATSLGIDDVTGSIEVGKRADLIVVPGNPLANLKVLSALGHLHYDDRGGVRTDGRPAMTIKGGQIFHGDVLREWLLGYVREERQGATPSTIWGLTS